jgi:hypothetical protein
MIISNSCYVGTMSFAALAKHELPGFQFNLSCLIFIKASHTGSQAGISKPSDNKAFQTQEIPTGACAELDSVSE